MGTRPADIQLRTLQFSRQIWETLKPFYRSYSLDTVIYQQLLRSSTSVSANIWEAQSASSKKDFLNYLQIALKSANETMHWILLIKSTTTHTSFDEVQSELEIIIKIIAKSVLTIKRKLKH